MKRRTSVSLKKHGEWLAEFHFQENVSLICATILRKGSKILNSVPQKLRKDLRTRNSTDLFGFL